jgi:hypothetical protein
MHTLGKSTVLLADKECSASSRINTFVISPRALELTEHLGNDSDVNFPATIATVVAEGGAYQALNRIGTEDVLQVRTDGNSKNTTYITLAAPAQKFSAGLEDCLTVCCSQAVADTLLIGQLWPTVRVSGVLAAEHLGARCNNGPVQTTLPMVRKPQLDVETTSGENFFCVSAEKMMDFVALRNIDFVVVALQSCMFGAWATAEPCLAQNVVMTAGCLGLVVAQSIRGSTKSDKSVDLTFQQDQDNDEVAPGYREPVLCLFSYEDRAVEPFAEETGAAVAAVGVYCAVMFPVADGRCRSNHHIAVNVQVDALACAHPADNNDNQFGIRSALLPNHARGVSLCPHGTSDLGCLVLPEQSIAQTVITSPSLDWWSRPVCPASLNGTYSAHVFAILTAHRAAPVPHQHLRSADSCASGVQLRLVGGRVPVSTPVPNAVIHTGTTVDIGGSVLALTRCQAVAGLTYSEYPAAGVSDTAGNHPAALKCVDRLSVADSVLPSGNCACTCVQTTPEDGIADAASMERVMGTIDFFFLGQKDDYISERGLFATTLQIAELVGLPSAVYTGRAAFPDAEMSHLAPPPYPAVCLRHDAWILRSKSATVHDKHSLATGDRLPGDATGTTVSEAETMVSRCGLRVGPQAANPVLTEALTPHLTVITQHGGSYVACAAIISCFAAIIHQGFMRIFPRALAALLTFALVCVRGLRRNAVSPVVRDISPWRCGFVMRVLYLLLLCGSSAVGARDDVNLATWSKPGQGLELLGAAAPDYAGYSVADAGDVNKDHYQDILIGAYGADQSGKTDAGAVYLIFGSPGRSTSTINAASDFTPRGIKISGAATYDRWGCSVSGAGDINKDDIDDFIIGGCQYSPPSRLYGGAAVVIFGKTSGWADIDLASFTSGSVGFWIWGAAAGDQCGKAVSGAGDVNGDGASDVIIGCDWASSFNKSQAGASYVVFGHSTTFTTIDLSGFNPGAEGFRISGATASDFSGFSVSGVGDVNGDGFGDVIIGAFTYDRPNGAVDCGAAYVIFGHSTATAFTDIDLAALPSSQGFRITGAEANDRVGAFVRSAGDFNHDGFDDILVGSTGNKAYVLFGHSISTIFANVDLATFAAGTAGFVVSGNGDLGYGVSGGTDINNDGVDDLAIAAPTASANGVVYVLYGRAQLQWANLNVLAGLPGVSGYRIIGAVAASSGGWAVSLVGDFDGDGVGDVLVGTQYADPPGLIDAGAAYLVYGELSAPTSQPSSQPSRQPSVRPTSSPVGERSGDVDLATWTKPGQGLEVWGALPGDTVGFSVADAGDINNDGYRDVLVGAKYADVPGKADAGAVYLVFGFPGRSASTVDTANAVPPKIITISGATAGDNWGTSVRGAGDINKDGTDDFICGGNWYDPPSRSNGGGAVVIFGKTGGWADIDLASFTSGSAGFWIYGAAAGDKCGGSTSGAGDVNSDGADDVIVGCDWAGPLNREAAGASYIVFGHSTAFATIDLSAFNTGITGFRILGGAVSDHTGNGVSAAGDINGDGYSDLVIGAYNYDGPSTRTDCGAAHVIFGHSAATAFTDIDLATLSSNQGFRITGAATTDQLGYSVSSAGDFNHDGYSDVVVGSTANKVYVLFGHSTSATFEAVDLAAFTAGTNGFMASGSEGFGYCVNGGVDVNRDGVDDGVMSMNNTYMLSSLLPPSPPPEQPMCSTAALSWCSPISTYYLDYPV